MLRTIRIAIFILMFTLGLVVLSYPYISNYMYNKSVLSLENKHEKIVYNMDKNNKESKELYDVLKNENDRIYKNGQLSFVNQKESYEKTVIDLNKYGIKDEVFGFIQIPSVDINLPIYLGANKDNMKRGAVHLTGTSYPIGGNNTNSVIAAHRSYHKSLMFRNIDKINIGDVLYIKNFNEKLVYRAVKISVIYPEELDKLTIVDGKDMITILSCHPFPKNYERYVVYFERV